MAAAPAGGVPSPEEEEAQFLVVGDQALVVSAVLAVEGTAMGVGDPARGATACLAVAGTALVGKRVMEGGAVEPGCTAPQTGVEIAALKETALLEGGITGLAMEVAQVLLEMLSTSDICRRISAGGTGRRHSPRCRRRGWLSCPPLTHCRSERVTRNPELSSPCSAISRILQPHTSVLPQRCDGFYCVLQLSLSAPTQDVWNLCSLATKSLSPCLLCPYWSMGGRDAHA